MKVLALSEGPDHVCYRYRIEACADALAGLGWTVTSLPLSPNTLPRSRQLRQAATADVVILQRKLLPLWQLRVLRRAARVLVYDFDDALFCRDSYNRKGPESWKRMAHFWATLYASDAVTAGNPFLHRQAADLIDPRRVHLMPTCIDPRRYALAAHHHSDAKAKLVWIGQQSTVHCLNHAEHLLSRSASMVPGLTLRVICDRFPDLDGIQVERRHWSTATEAAQLAEADIGISWLPDDAWSEGKCGLKVLQYMAAGLPVVANPVGMNREMIEHGRTGFLASTSQEWATAIRRLCADPPLRRRLGWAGRELVKRRYDIRDWSEKFAGLIDRLHRDRPDSATVLPPPIAASHAMDVAS